MTPVAGAPRQLDRTYQPSFFGTRLALPRMATVQPGPGRQCALVPRSTSEFLDLVPNMLCRDPCNTRLDGPGRYHRSCFFLGERADPPPPSLVYIVADPGPGSSSFFSFVGDCSSTCFLRTAKRDPPAGRRECVPRPFCAPQHRVPLDFVSVLMRTRPRPLRPICMPR